MLLGIIVFVAALIAILAVPLEFEFTVRREERTEGIVWFRWMFGRVFVKHELGRDRRRFKTKPSKEKNTTRKKKPNKPGKTLKWVIAALRSEGFVRRVLRLLWDLWRSLHAKASLRVRLGLDDPADTGCLWGLVGPLNAMLANLPRVDLSIMPDFEQPMFRLHGAGQIRVIPIQIFFIVMLFMLSPALWKAIWNQHLSGK